MRGFARGLAAAGLAIGFALPAAAQENLDAGKNGAQLYASNCAICHKAPQALGRGGILGLSGFLREHYTSSKESANAIATYVESTRPSAAPPKRSGPGTRTAKGDDKSKPGEKKTDAKPGDTKTTKPADAKPVEAKPADAKPAETKPAEAKASEPKPDAGPAHKPDETKKPD